MTWSKVLTTIPAFPQSKLASSTFATKPGEESTQMFTLSFIPLPQDKWESSTESFWSRGAADKGKIAKGSRRGTSLKDKHQSYRQRRGARSIYIEASRESRLTQMLGNGVKTKIVNKYDYKSDNVGMMSRKYSMNSNHHESRINGG